MACETIFWKTHFIGLSNYHVDGIRLDAVFTMHDSSPKHFLQELTESVKLHSVKVGRKFHLIAESGYNETRVLVLNPERRFRI